jgi:hypothetical protein
MASFLPALASPPAAVPLFRADNAFLGYGKGAHALYGLSRHIGEERMIPRLRATSRWLRIDPHFSRRTTQLGGVSVSVTPKRRFDE